MATEIAVDPRQAAREWIADTIAKHLHPDLQHWAERRIQHVAAAVEAEAFSCNMPIETAIELAVEWCEGQNEDAGLCPSPAIARKGEGQQCHHEV